MNNDTQATILSLETEVPKNFVLQEEFSETAAKILGLAEPHKKILQRIAAGSRIHKRHTVAPDFFNGESKAGYLTQDDTSSHATTSVRNQLYKVEAPNLAEKACLKALDAWGGDRKLITHIILVSCTGMVAPGIEFTLIGRLGLSRNVERLGINFMGCFGAFKGLSVAKAIARENPENRVLLVCVELCSLHFQADLNIDTMVANALFADGAAAAVIGVNPKGSEKPLVILHNQASAALEDTEDLMSWEACDHGFKMRLSAKVPTQLQNNIAPFINRLLEPTLNLDQCSWAVHPGGKAILQAIEKTCTLKQDELKASWKTLNDYGNMSSPTFLFVLKEALKYPDDNDWMIGLGFGPGLSFEGVLLKRVGDYVAK